MNKRVLLLAPLLALLVNVWFGPAAANDAEGLKKELAICQLRAGGDLALAFEESGISVNDEMAKPFITFIARQIVNALLTAKLEPDDLDGIAKRGMIWTYTHRETIYAVLNDFESEFLQRRMEPLVELILQEKEKLNQTNSKQS